MTPQRILLIQGHPDASAPHLCHALAQAYAQGAIAAGHEVREIEVAAIDFALLRSQHEWELGLLPASLKPAQADIGWAQHIVLFFPLWLGDMPALLKGFLEQVARPGFAFHRDEKNPFGQKALGGRSARIVVTMGMPALIYRWYFRAHGLKNLKRNILRFVGFSPVRDTVLGSVGTRSKPQIVRWFDDMKALGRRAA